MRIPVDDRYWSNIDDDTVRAVSFGLVATTALVSMFLVMAVFERLFRRAGGGHSSASGRGIWDVEVRPQFQELVRKTNDFADEKKREKGQMTLGPRLPILAPWQMRHMKGTEPLIEKDDYLSGLIGKHEKSLMPGKIEEEASAAGSSVEEVEANLARRPEKNKPAPIAKENLPQRDDSLGEDPQATKPSIVDPPIAKKEGSVEVVPPVIGPSTVDTSTTDKSRIPPKSLERNPEFDMIDYEDLFMPPSPKAEDPSITVGGAIEGVTRDVSEECSNEKANRNVNTNVLQDVNPTRDVEVYSISSDPTIRETIPDRTTLVTSFECDDTPVNSYPEIPSQVNIDPNEPSRLALRLLEALPREELSRSNFDEIFQIIDAIERDTKAPITLLGICQNVRESFWKSWEDREKVLSDDKQLREFSSKLTDIQSIQDKMTTIVTEHRRLVEENQRLRAEIAELSTKLEKGEAEVAIQEREMTAIQVEIGSNRLPTYEIQELVSF
ncbi:hypothetical protein MLD38_025842 [Melastoma candidum]|uniref:Uncharacterized protein n=1 Tax=Melastoma candidum TaxID=119954 RepID=A0ACB9NZI5_9MYRT|nr:hypothetical protein MLD38_025842 [Melastoma candidum]